jgi:predicted Zn finger-like uncharacterized protein
MSISIVICPECQAKLKVSGAMVPGKKIRCPKCQTPFAVPAEDEAPPLEESVTARPVKAPTRKAPPPYIADEEDQEDRPTRRSVRSRDEENEDEEDRPTRRTVPGRDMDDEDEDRPRRRKPTKRSKAKGNPALLWSLIGGGAVVLAGGIVVLLLVLNKGDDKSPEGKRPDGGPGPGLAAWNPDPAGVQELGPEKTYKGYRFRPPKGYNEVKLNARGNEQLAYFGPARPTGNAPTFVVSMITVPAAEANSPLENIFRNAVAGYENQVQPLIPDFKHGEIERGQINGLEFMRTQTTGTIAQNKNRVKGYFCLHFDGKNFVILAWLDSESEYGTSGKILEAAALSFKKG